MVDVNTVGYLRVMFCRVQFYPCEVLVKVNYGKEMTVLAEEDPRNGLSQGLKCTF